MLTLRPVQILQLTKAELVINWWVNWMILTNVFIWAVKKKVPIIKSQKGKLQNMEQHRWTDSSVRMTELSSVKSVSGTGIHMCSSGSLCWGLLPLSVCLFVLSRNSTERPSHAPVFQGFKDHLSLKEQLGWNRDPPGYQAQAAFLVCPTTPPSPHPQKNFL